MNQTIEVLRAHRSIRKFKDKPVDEELFRSILEAAQCAATSNFIQAYTIIRVNDKHKRRAIAELAGPQIWVEQAPVFLIFCADLNRLYTACRMHNKALKSGYAEQFIVATVDTALMAQNTMIAAESLGLGGVFIGGIRNDPQKVCDLLEIPDHAYPVFGMCLGYPDDDPLTKPRFPLDAILKTDRYSVEDDDVILRDYDQTTQEYYMNRDHNVRDDSWTRLMADFMSRKIRPHMKSFIETKGFFIR